MNIELIVRVIGLILFGVGGLALNEQILVWFPALASNVTWVKIIGSVVSGIVGFVIAPWISIRPFHKLRQTIQQLPGHTLILAIIGLIAGLAIGTLTAYPISLLPGLLGQFLPFIVAALFGYMGIMITTMRTDLVQIVRERFFSKEEKGEREHAQDRAILLDTSVIIDGRISDICHTGFLQGELVVPLFVLNELQHIADSSDTLRRNRGRRGLEILSQLQDESLIPVRITDEAVEGVKEVDDKLIALARQLGGSILTNDYNLNRVADLQGVTVLNVNELANAVKTVLLPGETFSIHILQEGKESDQGVGYLDDGTMVVVEGGRNRIGKTTTVMVNKVLQTAAGRMIFARPE
ncbi:MAG: TRAM domain-containing protein [Chloroflexota bacterium]|nr:TRAM domain-containing protein [Chloroflexota bacterium]